jgi:hypothetical protein
VSIDSLGPVGSSGSESVTPTQTKIYHLVVAGPEGTKTASVQVTVTPPTTDPPPTTVASLPTVSISASPNTILLGQSTTLAWTTIGADKVAIDGIGPVAASGSMKVSPSATTVYQVTASGPGGTQSASAQVTVTPPPPTVSISASPKTILPGQSTTLAWTTTGADKVAIDGIGPVAASGAQEITPDSTTSYEVTATGPVGTQRASVQVMVTPLAHWLVNGLAGKKLVVWGNSTVSNAVYFFYRLATYCKPGQPLDGLGCSPVTYDDVEIPRILGSIYNYGNNGASLAGLLNGSGPYPIDAVCTAKPDLLIMRGPLINDVRLGQCDLGCATVRVQQALERLEQCTPDSSILLTTENSLLTTDPGNFHWVQPATAAAAQTYTDILHDAVMAMSGKYPNVLVYDVMAEEYGTVAPPTSTLMPNQLHPGATGQQAEADLLVQIIGVKPE